MERKKDDKENLDLSISNLIKGTWLLAHDLADRAIHAVSENSEAGGFFASFLKTAHASENTLKKIIKAELENFGLATKEDVKELESEISRLSSFIKFKRG